MSKKPRNQGFWNDIAERAQPEIDSLIEAEVKRRIDAVRIFGKTLNEVTRIVGALEIERITGIEMTMANLDQLDKIRQIEREATIKKINEIYKGDKQNGRN